MIRYFLKGLQAHFHSGRSLLALSLLGVAVGVASVVSIQIININALGAFQGSVQAVSGEADLSVVGRGPVLAEDIYARVLSVPGVAAAWPLYRVEVALAGREDFFLEIVGFDLFAPLELPWKDLSSEPVRQTDALKVDFAAALGDRGWVAVSPALAGQMGWEEGDRLEVTIGSRRAELLVGALVDFQKATPLASRNLAVMDISQAQGLLGNGRELHQVDLQTCEGVNRSEFASELQDRLGTAVQVLTPEQRERQAAGLLSSFRLNLTALSLISVFVGGFLIYSSTQASLVRRRAEFGLLRSLGATRRQLLALILGETCVLGLAGVAVGIPLGYIAAASNVGRVSAMLSNVYVLREIETLQMPPWLYPLAIVMGLAAALAGSLLPALDVSRKDTRSLLASFTLHERMGAAARPLFILGWLVLAVGIFWYGYRGQNWRPGGFVLAISLLLSIPLMTPFVTQQGVKRVKVRGFGFAFGFKGLGLQLQTTPFAIAALAVAVSMMVGITVMVGSFRRTLDVWVNQTLQADIYITSPSWRRGAREATLDPEVVSDIASHPGVEGVDLLRQFFTTTGGRRISLAGVHMDLPVGSRRFSFIQGNSREALRRFHEDGAVLLGEPLARKAGLGVGEDLVIETPAGPVAFPIAGVYYDYSSDSGAAVMSLRTMEEHFGSSRINNLALYLEPGRDAEQVMGELRSRLKGVPLAMRSNRRLREEVFRIFDQTFAVTRLLQVMSLAIAVCGITLTLLVLARERVSELALFRALGADRRQIFRTYLGKGLGMAVFGLILGGVGGVLLAVILIFIINRTFFGWTIALYWPWDSLAGEAVAILLASVAGSIYPALRASRTPATELRREDV